MNRTSIALALLLNTSAALAAPVIVTTGRQGGTYHDQFGVNLSKALAGLGYEARLVESKGSWDNLQRLSNGEAQVGFTQADILADFYRNSIGGADKVEVLGELGKECVYIAYKKDGKVRDEDDLQQSDKKPVIAVGDKDGGGYGTWKYMVQLESNYKASTVVFDSGTRALNKLKLGQVDAVLWVTSPTNFNHKLLQALNANKGLGLLDVNDKDLNDKLPSGEAVYTFEEVSVGEGMWADDVDTICTQAVLVINKQADPAMLEALSDLISLSPGVITTGPK